MPEIKNTFTQGKMNKDLDERIIPNGQYRDAMNVQVSTSDGSDIGTVQNILGNTSVEKVVDISGAKCIGSISNEKTNKLYWFIKSNNVDAILEFSEYSGPVSVLIDTKAGTVDAVLKFPNSIITGINIIDDLLLWTDGVNEPKRINIERCKLGNLALTSLSSASHTKLVVGGSVVTDSYSVEVDIKEEHITSIKRNPLKSLTIIANQAEIEGQTTSIQTPLFEKTFPRFSYRYRYEDGEYSTYAPFTDVVFKSLWGIDPDGTAYDINNAYGTKEPFNNAMRNMLSSVELKDFVSPNTPLDVVRIDLLYKQEDSNVVYILETIESNDEEWDRDGSNFNSKYKGSFTVTNENIYAAIPENQLVRPWDNIPRSALAQEVTGNRVVYGNYKQGYDLDETPKIITDFITRDIGTFDQGGLPSIKSQRDYQVGIVYGDKYGRETPVFTTENASLTVPWGTPNPNMLLSQQLMTSIETQHPTWADYYKFFVKETSGEYYNLIMDGVYKPTKEDLSEEDHVWLSFPSSDRNKISEDDYITLKKRVGVASTPQEMEENKYRILDIKNEAPDAIKYKYGRLGEISNKTGELQTLFSASTLGPASDRDFLQMKKAIWQNPPGTLNPGMSLTVNDESTETHDLFMSFYKEDANGNINRSERFKISAVRISNTVYEIHLEKPLPSDFNVNFQVAGTSSDELHDETVLVIEEKIVKNLEAFSGRFFAKVYDLGIVDTLTDSNQVITSYRTTNYQDVHWHADKSTVSFYDPDAGLVNNSSYDLTTLTAGDDTKTIASINSDITNTEVGWQNILDSVGTNRFFIDNMYMAASQPSDTFYARHSGQGWYGGNPSPKGDIIYSTSNNLTDNWGAGGPATSTLPTGYIDIFNGSPYHGTHPQGMAFPQVSDIQPQNPTNTNNGDNMINGIPGIITTNGDHNGTTGIRRWKDSIHNSNLTPNVYPTQSNKNVMHLSFLAPGEDLVQSTPSWSDTNGIASNLEGIWGGGVFTKADGSSLANPNSIGGDDFTKGLAMEHWGAQGSHQGNQPAYNVISYVHEKSASQGTNEKITGYHVDYKDKHEKQWKPEWSGGVYNANVEAFILKLNTPEQKFRFKDDPSGHIYTIKRVKEKRIYNHTPWRRMYKHNYNTGNVVATGDSVEEAAITWADTRSSSNRNGLSTERGVFEDKIQDFGKANNRRVCYIIHLEDSTFPVNGGLDPSNTANTSSLFNSVDFNAIQFVEKNFSLNDGGISENPAIWETEPKDNVDLDIYYEAGQAYPITLTENNRELFAQASCKVELSGIPSLATGDPNIIGTPFVVSFPEDMYLSSWSTQAGANIITLDTDVQAENVGDGSGTNLVYNGIRVKFIRDDGSFTTGQIVDGDPTTAVQYSNTGRKEFEIIPTTGGNHGLSWYNCFSFGNGVESNRVRDDFNGMILSNGVRANTTLDVPYAEEHRESGLIYSGIYNSTSSVNNLNQFIAAEKITKDLNPTFGSIQKLFSRRISLIAFCEDRVVGITANKSALYNADGNPQIVASNAVLGDANPFVGDYGISKNPESFAKESYRAYFTDKQRGAVLRLSMDGLTPISDAGMHDYFRDNLKIAEKLIGTYDDYKKDYNLTLASANFLPENVVSNSEFEEGSGTNTEFYNNQEYITNGNFANGNNVANPSQPMNVAENSDLDSKTTITNYDSIGQYTLQPSQAAIIPSNWVDDFPSNGTIYKMNFQTQSSNPQVFGTLPTKPYTGGGTLVPSSNNAVGLNGDAVHWDGWVSMDGLVGTGYNNKNTPWFQNSETGSYGGANIRVKLVDPNSSSNVLGSGLVASGMASSFPNAINPTLFHGEIFKVNLTVQNYGGHMTPATTADVDFKVELLDNTNTLIAPGLFMDSITANNIYDPVTVEGYTIDSRNLGYVNNSSLYQGATTSGIKFSGLPTVGGNIINLSFYFALQGTLGTHFDFTTYDGNSIFQMLSPVVANGFNLRFSNTAGGSKTNRVFIKNVEVEKIRRWTDPGNLTQQDESIGEPPINILPWAKVEHAAVNHWSADSSNLVLNDNAIDTYGPDTGSGTTVTYDVYSGGLVTGTATYLAPPDPNPNGNPPITAHNQYATGDFYPPGRLEILSGTANLTQDITSNPLVAGEWYEVILMGVNGTGNILVTNALDPSSTSGSTLPGHLGVVGSGLSTEKIIFDTQGHPTATGQDWKVRWQQYSSSNELKLLFNSFVGTIDRIEFADISDKATGGGADDWSLVGNDPIYHYYSPRKVLRYHDNVIRWGYDSNNDGTVDVGGDDGQPAYQSLASWALPVTNDGYELRFQISLFNNVANAGSLQGYVTGPFEAVDAGHTYGFEFDGITQGGYYKVTGNLDGTTTPTIERTLPDYVTPTTSNGTITASLKDHPGPGHADKVLFRPTDGSFFKGQISFVSLKDITNYFTSASVGGWEFVGFDPGFENYITWDNTSENISFTNAPVGTSIQQALPNTNFVNGATVEFSFDASITALGSISGYFYNGVGEGFTFGPVTGGDGYNGTHVIGDDESAISDTSLLRNTLVIHVDTEPVDGTIDNFALYRVYPEITPSTVTYSEDTKGWVSFKSFIPESGLSLSKNYYTMKDGKLWQHHSNETRNWFYGERDESDNPIIAESTITAMLNAEPSLIKTFNTLNYEGSQSKINLHTTEDVFDANGGIVTLSNAEVYNLNAKDGWYVDSIITDKQSGSIKEFIEKEGKWFNYIKGTGMTETTLPSTADLSFQGLGMVSNTI